MRENRDIIIVAAITLGIPVILLMVLLSGNSSVNEGLGSAVSLIFVGGMFLAGFAFEIKRLVDLPDVGEHPKH